jgi:hypothetical protein
MVAKLRLKSGTAAQLDAAVISATLAASEPYFVTDELTLAVGTGGDSYSKLALVSQFSKYDYTQLTLIQSEGTYGQAEFVVSVIGVIETDQVDVKFARDADCDFDFLEETLITGEASLGLIKFTIRENGPIVGNHLVLFRVL